ncbi:MAG: FprA family A-type flavoprotein [Bacteroidales bacterium]|nr:FprA family A-type flavoprotein [Bacteroidales bacterium]
MYKPVKITDHIYWVGVNDRRTHLFENIWPLEKGVSYNSYLIVDEKVALIDTVEISKMNDFFEKIESAIGDKKVDYLIINHLEPDHSGAIKATIQRYPEIQIVGNKQTFKILNEFYGIKNNLYEITRDTQIDLGKHQLSFFITPMLHWPETMMTYEQTNKIIFSGDAFGSYGTLDGGVIDEELNTNFYDEEVSRYYSNIVGKYWNPVQKALSLLKNTQINIIASTHGPVWKRDVKKIVALYNKWSRFEADTGVVIVYGSMYGNTEKMAEIMARVLNENGIKEIRIYDSSKTHISYIINDIFKYKGTLFGSSTYNGIIFPPMGNILSKIINTGVKNRLLGIFGSATWGGGAVKALEDFAEKMKWDVVGDPVQARGAPDISDIEKCEEIARIMAKQLLN